VVFDKYGNLYAVANGGGTCGGACGAVIKLTSSQGTWTEEVLHDFQDNGSDGFLPYGTPILDGAGNFYGTTYFGGSAGNSGFGYGTVYEITP